MRLIYCIFLCCIFLSGCSTSKGDKQALVRELRVERAILTEEEEVTRAEVSIVGQTALIGIETDDEADVTIRQEVEQLARQTDPILRHISVTRRKDLVNRISNLS
ncbi:MAG: YhcN/YlaJ family sporulation lipoprotein [Clostridiales bacterium]|nr:YhcN/YlaJ family sporulation lipoprotein [Clostridiales bacterium]